MNNRQFLSKITIDIRDSIEVRYLDGEFDTECCSDTDSMLEQIVTDVLDNHFDLFLEYMNECGIYTDSQEKFEEAFIDELVSSIDIVKIIGDIDINDAYDEFCIRDFI